jgi:hypothetical protein
MGEIQDLIEEHLTLDNCFVKSIQIIGKSDDGTVIIPIGFNVRFISCNFNELVARDSAIHFIGGTAKRLQLNECIVSIDAMTVSDLLQASDSRINIKELPEKLKPADGSVTSTAMTISGAVDFRNVESFWNKVTWNCSSQGSNILNSRIEFSNCTLALNSELEIAGTEWYNVLGSYAFSRKVTIKELEAQSSSADPEQEIDPYNSEIVSVNKVRGSAGVGAGSICQFKKVESISLDSEGTFDITGSEVNFFDIEKMKSSEIFATYKQSSGKISDCKLESQKECIKLDTTGNLHITNSEFKSKDVTVEVIGSGSNCTVQKGTFESSDKDCFSCKNNSLLDMFEVESIKGKPSAIKSDNASVCLVGCKTVEAEENTFDFKSGAVLESSGCETFKGKINFKGENASFLVKGSTKLEATEKIVSGSGVFVANP